MKKMKNKKAKEKKDIFICEMWSNEMRCNCFYGDMSHEVSAIHFASSLKKAIKFCETHLDYGGHKGQDDFFPWHWEIRQRKVNEDDCCVVHSTNELIETIYP